MRHPVQLRDVLRPNEVYEETTLPFLPPRGSFLSVGSDLYYVKLVYVHDPRLYNDICATLIVDINCDRPAWLK